MKVSMPRSSRRSMLIRLSSLGTVPRNNSPLSVIVNGWPQRALSPEALLVGEGPADTARAEVITGWIKVDPGGGVGGRKGYLGLRIGTNTGSMQTNSHQPAKVHIQGPDSRSLPFRNDCAGINKDLCGYSNFGAGARHVRIDALARDGLRT